MKEKLDKIEKLKNNFNIQKYEELFNNPPSKIKTFENEYIKINKFIFRKYLIAIKQMLFNSLDIWILNVGKEGSAKTSYCSHQALTFYYILEQLDFFKFFYYEYKLEGIMNYTLKEMLESIKKYREDFFRILILDESDELKRDNWNSPNVKKFLSFMRRVRKTLKIFILNIPQLKELKKNVILDRVNFCFEMYWKNNSSTHLVDKGFGKMLIIPRGEFIYSNIRKNYIQDEEIRNKLSNILDDKKKPYVRLPRDLCYIEFDANTQVFTFDKKEYNKKSNEANYNDLEGDLTLTRREMELLSQHFTPSKLGLKREDDGFSVLQKFRSKIIKVLSKQQEQDNNETSDEENNDFNEDDGEYEE